jgi:GT2 family glycosyltransferase
VLPQRTAPVSARLGELVSDASFAVPDWHATSAWYGHAPFAFWLVQALQPRLIVELGVFAGFSYFTFCEAAERYAPDARLVGIDSWEGDEHAGPLEPGTRWRVEVQNERYRSRSAIWAETFDVAVDRFSPGQIDLLHIDGLHTYDAVRHDFEAWLPKLSGKGVVLLHDTEVHEREFGVWRLMAELETRFPTFRFTHDHGLGVVGVGARLPSDVRRLLAAGDDDDLRTAVREAYGLIGSRIGARRNRSTEMRANGLAPGWGSDRVREALELRARLRASEDRLRSIESSRIWRLTAPYRGAASTVRRRRESLRRRGVFRSALPRYARQAVEADRDAEGWDDGRRAYASWVRSYDTLGPSDVAGMRTLARSLATGPLASVVMAVWDPALPHLEAALDSLRAQAYGNWQLCAAFHSGDRDARSLLEDYARRDPRIDLAFGAQSAGITAAADAALDLARGEIVVLLEQDDVLRPHALLLTAQWFIDDPALGYVYSDEDVIDDAGFRSDPYFKPDWNPELLRSHNYLRHVAAFRTDLARRVGGFRPGLGTSREWDLALRITALLDNAQIGHIPHVLYHWRPPPASGPITLGPDARPRAAVAAGGSAVVEDHLRRLGVSGTVAATGKQQNVRYAVPREPPLVSVVVPTTMRAGLFDRLLEGLSNTMYRPMELVRVATPAAIIGSPPLSAVAPPGTAAVDVELDGREFNFSRAVNLGCAAASGSMLLIVNDDIEILHPDWLEMMVGHVTQPMVGAVGALLLSPREHVQHAGVLLGAPDEGPIAGHLYHGAAMGDPSYAGRVRVNQDLSCVTGACMLLRRKAFEEVGGFDEEFAVAYNDVDFCLRLRERGWRIVFTPDAILTHVESATFESHRKGRAEMHQRDVEEMRRRWCHVLGSDPAHNPNLAIDWARPWRLAFPPRVSYPWRAEPAADGPL